MYEESILSKATRQQFMRQNVLFKQLTKKRVEFFTDQFSVELHHRGAPIMFEGEPAKSFFIVYSGDVTITKAREQMNRSEHSKSKKDIIFNMPVQQPVAPIKRHINLVSQELLRDLELNGDARRAIQNCERVQKGLVILDENGLSVPRPVKLLDVMTLYSHGIVGMENLLKAPF